MWLENEAIRWATRTLTVTTCLKNNKEQGLSVFGIPTEQDGGHLRKLHAAAHSVMELRFFMFTQSDEKWVATNGASVAGRSPRAPPRFQNSRWINIGAEVEQASDSLIMAHENRIIQS